jgi:hypothetical protein
VDEGTEVLEEKLVKFVTRVYFRNWHFESHTDWWWSGSDRVKEGDGRWDWQRSK